MDTWISVALVFGGLLILLPLLLYAGMLVQPRVKQPELSNVSVSQKAVLPSYLPPAARRHFEQVFNGSEYPMIESAVIWGRWKIKAFGFWAPGRFTSWYQPGRQFFRQMEIAWFGRPLLKGTESLLNGAGLIKVGGSTSVGPNIDQSENIGLWAEAVWMPSILLSDPRLRWESLDPFTARLTVPGPFGPEALLLSFDPESGLLTHLAAQRFASAQEQQPSEWFIALSSWKRFGGLLLPGKVCATWVQQGSPSTQWFIQGAAYNVDVSSRLGL